MSCILCMYVWIYVCVCNVMQGRCHNVCILCIVCMYAFIYVWDVMWCGASWVILWRCLVREGHPATKAVDSSTLRPCCRAQDAYMHAYIPPHRITLHCIARHCITLINIALLYHALHYTTLLDMTLHTWRSVICTTACMHACMHAECINTYIHT